MVQIIGLMVGSYILVRCVEIIGGKEDRFENAGWRSATRILAVFVAIFAIYGCVTLIKTGDKLGEARSQFGRD